ncbi:PREDICTED: TNF receptor-associated factor 3-like isoform X2 [Amphimedon queenslandica]|uniref:RING-type domain-containing protein n=1 Tax=Amphimedon queenslandica TaxID=400682 RepID=A0AAN0JUK5_AMPQE|nr:PREDICTED: TNF receptor-associated factor 3-like isoform X2 [Amphimedon queenslandica]|eukprot:XP_019860742.1 PREDICTED: TNF receptor-associated factor 3-like isoform X2 [Amphimedon queenslandica]
MAQFSKEELSFVEDLPKHMEIECPVCLNILTDPHLVSCCGHNFCGSCIERLKASNGSCPLCKEKEYQAMVNKERFRIINGLEVYCSNKEKGCQWKGELKNMSTHLNKEKREGECQYEEVKCRYEKCQERKQRRYLKYHEDRECPQRPFQCQYCRRKGTFLSITKDHYEECRQYPVTCPNKCSSTNMPRGSLTAHINECPLEPVDCVFSWAGCNDKPLRKDVHVHTADTMHMTLLAVACGQLKKENEQMKQEISNLKSRPYHEYPLLPIGVTKGRPAVHFYFNACGRHMSARAMVGNISSGLFGDTADYFIFLAFHKGNFDHFKPKLPKVFFAKCGTEVKRLVVDTYKPLPHDILNGIKQNESGYDTSTLPQNHSVEEEAE